MHEVSLIRTIFRTLEEEFPQERLNTLSAIDLQVGVLSNVEPLLMKNAFSALTTAENKYQSVELNITTVPIEIYCKKCGIHSEIESYKFVCSNCRQPNNNVVKGTELLIHRVHFNTNN